MRLNKKNLAKKLKKYHQKPVVSKKDERKIRKGVKQFRKLQKEHHDNTMNPIMLALENELEQQRIIREVEKGT